MLFDKIFRAIFPNWFDQRARQNVCCFHFGRCGSTLIGNLLNSHPSINWQSELFHAIHENAQSVNASEAYGLLSKHIDLATSSCFGFETKFQHLDGNGLDVSLDQYLQRLETMAFSKFLVLKRSNYLRQAISVARGQHTKVWHVTTDKPQPKFESFHFDTELVSLGGRHRTLLDCFGFLDHSYQQAKATMDGLQLDCLWLEYEEDLQTDPSIGLNKVLDFLNLPRIRPSISLRKLDHRPIDQMISNADEVHALLHGTRFEWMLTAS